MDFLKEGEQFLGNQGGQGQNQQNQGGAQNQNQSGNDQNQNQNQGGAQNNAASSSQEDYGDKGLDFIEKKTGHTLGRDTNEKITDGARGLFEKATGNTNINPKWSN